VRLAPRQIVPFYTRLVEFVPLPRVLPLPGNGTSHGRRSDVRLFHRELSSNLVKLCSSLGCVSRQYPSHLHFDNAKIGNRKIGVSVLSYCLAHRLPPLSSRKQWSNLSWGRLCVMLVLFDSYVRVFYFRFVTFLRSISNSILDGFSFFSVSLTMPLLHEI
jgi:hypothetical protein